MVLQMVPGGTNYSAVDSPGGLLRRGTVHSVTDHLHVLPDKMSTQTGVPRTRRPTGHVVQGLDVRCPLMCGPRAGYPLSGWDPPTLIQVGGEMGLSEIE